MIENKKSFLRWAGSKQKLLPVLNKYWIESSNRYIEPFMGSSQLFFSINPKKAILNDINQELVQTYLQVKKNPYAIFSILKDMKVCKENYYKVRSQNPKHLGVNQRAARFIYLNQLCFNGIYRTNLKGEFNVPYSGENQLKSFSLDLLVEVSKRLQRALIYNQDFETLINREAQRGDFIYLDPPFAVSNRRIFRQYDPQCFGLEDINRLNTLLQTIDSRGSQFLLSYAYCKEALTLINDWNYKKVFTQRNIAGFAKFRRKSAELLIFNFNLKEAAL